MALFIEGAKLCWYKAGRLLLLCHQYSILD
jgi:hypothetical protein